MKHKQTMQNYFVLLIAWIAFAVMPLKAQVLPDSQVPVSEETLDSTRKALNAVADTLYISEVEDVKGLPDKVLHAEPLYIDLIRDLGARKGEHEWNLGWGMTDRTSYTRYEGLIEYEFAPVHRLGLEIEVPFSFYRNNPEINLQPTPFNRINGLKLAAQYSFFVSEKYKTTMAIGYIHEFEVHDFQKMRRRNPYKGNLYNPFFIVAKRFGNNFHTLIYADTKFLQTFEDRRTVTEQGINTSLHYMISGTRNFVGVELNKDFYERQFDMVIRPQLRLGVTDNLLLGIVSGVPISRKREGMSVFMRMIYEPKHRK